MSLQDLTNISISLQKSLRVKTPAKVIKKDCKECRGHKELISILSKSIVEVFSENQMLLMREKELIAEYIKLQSNENALNNQLAHLQG